MPTALRIRSRTIAQHMPRWRLRCRVFGANSQPGFTLIELLVVMAILALLAAMVMPVFSAARGKARSATCTSNLRQIGMAFFMYAQDYDDRFPWGIDIVDRYAPFIWNPWPQWKALIPFMPLMHHVLYPYLRSGQCWRCPADIGCTYVEISHADLDARPTAYERYGASYAYRTELTFRGATLDRLEHPSEVNVLADLTGTWHGGRSVLRTEYRYHVLFADWHVKNVSLAAHLRAWDVRVE